MRHARWLEHLGDADPARRLFPPAPATAAKKVRASGEALAAVSTDGRMLGNVVKLLNGCSQVL